MEKELDFEKMNGLLPCVIQDAASQKVLMVGFMNSEALAITEKTKRVTLFSRTRKRLWTKGETSGNYLDVVSITPDCDQDSLLVKARPKGPVCHTGQDTCFAEKNEIAGLGFLERVINDRKRNPQPGSYTNKLFEAGINRIAQKVGEEAVELVIESKDNDDEKFLSEAADLMYHYLVLLAARERTLDDVVKVLRERHSK